MPARIFTIAQQKGGAGKTTLGIHLAVAWAGMGNRVAALDIDPQASLSRWHEERAAIDAAHRLDFAAASGWRTRAEVERLARAHDIVVIDSPPHAETEARIAVRAAHLVIVPMQPSPMDLWASKATLDLARSERVPALIVLNRVPPRSKAAEEVIAAARNLGVAVADQRIGNRVALATSILRGLAITESEPGGQAAREITALAEELLRKASG